ncbi:MAG TPA: hypothetical protein VJ299_04630, partial [Steroidobacteraceae bacterium]|nr:hypothetical protein [Steroidobacteraceae bacterium]
RTLKQREKYAPSPVLPWRSWREIFRSSFFAVILAGSCPSFSGRRHDTERSFQRRVRRWCVQRPVQTEEITLAKIAKEERLEF